MAKNPFPRRRPRACTASKSDFRRKRRCAGRVSRSRGARPSINGLRALWNELPATLGPAPAEDPATGLGRDARAKAVRALTAQLARLVGTLHGLKGLRKRAARLSRA